MKTAKKVLALVLCLCMLLGTLQLSGIAAAGGQKVVQSLPFATISDPHIFPDSEQGTRSPAWMEYGRLVAKMFNESETIIRTALTTCCERAKKNGTKYILIPGDLTKDSEYAAHKCLAKMLLEFEDKYGVQFLVINGNHDIANQDACTFKKDKYQSARALNYKEFAKLYKNLGYDLLAKGTKELPARYSASLEPIPGALSYVADLGDAYRLIVVDTCKYSFDEAGPLQTDGAISEELMQWIEAWTKKTYAEGKVPFMMAHHSFAAHMEVEPSITHAFVLDEYVEAADRLAAAGIHYVFTGHLHTTDVACVVNDDGDAIYDVETDSVTGYPNTYRENKLVTYKNGQTKLNTKVVDFDATEKMTFDGVTYDNHTYKNKAFALCFGGGLSKDGKPNATAFAMGLVKAYAGIFIDAINEAGGILAYLKTLNIDLREILSNFLYPYIGNGFQIGGMKVFTVDNLLWFIEDLLDQISELYLKDPDNLYATLEPIVEKLMTFEVSELPCTKFLGTLGFGDKTKPGTMGDLVLSAMTYWFDGNEDASDDAFLLDAIDGFDNRDTLERFFYFLVDIALNDIVEDMLLSHLEIRLGKLFGNKFLMKQAGDGLDYLVKQLLRGDNTYMNLVNIVFALDVLPYKDLYDVLDQLLFQKYVTPSLFEGMGQFVAFVLNDFSSDTNPKFKGDYGVSYTSAKAKVEATQKNYRLPTMVSVTMGKDSKTQAFIGWFSKYSLPATDIEIYQADSEPTFTGKANKLKGVKIKTESELVERQFPGIDLDISGVLWYLFKLQRHTVRLSGLQPGATYYYRVGNAQYGWWSPTGVLRTADGSKDVTFLHLSDQQSQNERQYNECWVPVLKSAFENYGKIDFIADAGDLVDHGDNNRQWQAMFDTGESYLLNTFLMPATGNHGGFGTNATVNYFTLPNMPKQDTETGVYYSFDYNNVHVSVLNTEALDEDNALTQEQITWLKRDVKKAADADWHFVMFHKALYSHGSHYKDKDVIAMRKQLGTLMPELGIDVVLTGHDHVYLRTASLVGNEKADTTYTYLEKDGDIYKAQVQPTGTTYLISGTAGVKFYKANDNSKTDKYFPRGEKILTLDTPMYSAYEIRDKVLYMKAYTVKDGKTVQMDSFAIRKDPSQGKSVDYTEDVPQENEPGKLETTMQKIKDAMQILSKLLVNLTRIYVLRAPV